jgi:hypothetical protein
VPIRSELHVGPAGRARWFGMAAGGGEDAGVQVPAGIRYGPRRRRQPGEPVLHQIDSFLSPALHLFRAQAFRVFCSGTGERISSLTKKKNRKRQRTKIETKALSYRVRMFDLQILDFRRILAVCTPLLPPPFPIKLVFFRQAKALFDSCQRCLENKYSLKGAQVPIFLF